MFVIKDSYSFIKSGYDGRSFETKAQAINYLLDHGFKYDTANDNGDYVTYKATGDGWTSIAVYVEIVEVAS